jgi:hypothetical protein
MMLVAIARPRKNAFFIRMALLLYNFSQKFCGYQAKNVGCVNFLHPLLNKDLQSLGPSNVDHVPRSFAAIGDSNKSIGVFSHLDIAPIARAIAVLIPIGWVFSHRDIQSFGPIPAADVYASGHTANHRGDFES